MTANECKEAGRKTLLRLVLAALAAVPGARAADPYQLSVEGPRNVYAGHSAYVQMTVRFAAVGDHVYLNNVQVPPGVSFNWICYNGTGNCWKAQDERLFIWNATTEAGATLQLTAGSEAVPGSHAVTVTTESLGATREIEIPIQVLPAPVFEATPPAQSPAIPGLSKWEQTALTGGKKWCKPDAVMNFGWSQDAWYYDGARVFFQLADYTGDPSWEACALNIAQQYRDRVVSSSGYMAGYNVFPHGLRMAYERTGDESYKQALILLSEKAAFAGTGGGVTDDLIRETAYAANAYMEAEKAGAPRHPRLSRSIDYLLGHFEQIFERQQYRIHQPFFDGLAAEALIQYWEMTGDARIPHAIRRMLDWTWEYGWDHHKKSMVYNPDTIPREYGTDLVHLIAPAFAWYYSITGNAAYLRRGDELFLHALDSDVSYSAKNFNQNYRWSFAYVAWRRATLPVGLALRERVTASELAQGEVVLGAPAIGPCGQSVRLTSSDAGVLWVPGSVKVPAGATLAPVKLAPEVVQEEKTVEVVARYTRSCHEMGSTAVFPVTVVPDGLRVLLNRQRQAGGAFANSRIVLDGAAPKGGYPVTLSTNRPDLVRFLDGEGTISTVAIEAAEKSSGYFLVDTRYVGEPTVATIRATGGGMTADTELTILPPYFRINLLAGPTVTGGGVTRLNQVVLKAPAPAGGARVELSSSDPALQVVEAVVVPEGEIAAGFELSTAVVSKFTTATLTARYGGETTRAAVSINALLMSLTLPSTLKAGAAGTGTVVLSAKAPGDLTVALSVEQSAPVEIPPSVTIPKGQNSAVFQVLAKPAGAGGATVAARLGDQTKTGAVTVVP